MKNEKSWPKKHLKKLHTWNAWIILALAVTGVILYFPGLRGPIAAFRVNLKQLHIVLGLVSIFLLLFYLPSFKKHYSRINRKNNQRYNLIFIIALIVGWGISGIVLWQFRSLPPVWSSIALFIHDFLTFIGVPYAIYHSVSRSKWVKKAIRFKRESDGDSEKIQPSYTRRKFLRLGIGSALVLIAGPLFYRWLRSVANGSGDQTKNASNGNDMFPEPQPSKGTFPLKEGGGEGTFRPYTVTQYPTFSSESWQFSVNGHVNHPNTWNWREFLQIPREIKVRDFHCVTGWSVYHVTWEGIPLSYFLNQAGVQQRAKYVKFYSGDGVYTDTLTLEQAHMDDCLVAVLRDGKPIPQAFGGPVRLVVPEMYGYKSVKWLTRIELIDEPWTGFWERRGYKKDAWVEKGHQNSLF